MAGLSALVWLCAIGIFIGGLARIIQKRVVNGLLLIGVSVVIWLFSLAMLADSAPTRATQPPRSTIADDLEVVTPSWKRQDGQVIWDITLHNKNASAAYADIQYRTTYRAPSGTEVTAHRGTIFEVLKPGETRQWRQLQDGFVNDQAITAGFEIVSATRR